MRKLSLVESSLYKMCHENEYQQISNIINTSQSIYNLAMEQKLVHCFSTTHMHTTPLTRHKPLLIRLSIVVIITLNVQDLFIFLLNKLNHILTYAIIFELTTR